MNRRHFLQTSAASPVVFSAGAAFADETDGHEVDLDFDFDVDRRTVTITALFKPEGSQVPTAGNNPKRWTLDAHRFGRTARFVFRAISSASGQKIYQLRIEKGRFGEISNARLVLTFYQRMIGDTLRFGVSARLRLFEYGSQEVPGRLEGANELLGKGADGESLSLFRDVADPAKAFQQFFTTTIPVARASEIFGKAFYGLVWHSNEVPAIAEVRLVLHSHLVFSVLPLAVPGNTQLHIGDPALTLQLVTFGWMMPSEAEQNVDTAGKKAAELAGEAEREHYDPDTFELLGTAVRSNANTVMLLGGQGPTVWLTQFGPSPQLQALSEEDESGLQTGVFLLRSESERRDGGALAEAVLPGQFSFYTFSIHEKNKDIKTHGSGLFNELAGRLMLRAEKETGQSNPDFSLSFDADFISTKPQKIETPVGRLVLRGATLSPADDGAKFKREGKRKSDPPAFSDPFARRWGQQVSIVWAIARTERRRLSWLEVNMLLLEHTAGLPDASFSRLTFEPTDLRIIWLPRWVDVEADTLVSTIRLGPELGTRIDLSRATLRAARSDDLLWLGFRFDGVWLAYDEDWQPELVKDNNVCAAPVHNGGSGDDARPLIAIDFPGQHLFEEAVYLPKPEPMPDVDLELTRVWVERATGKINFEPKGETAPTGWFEIDPGKAIQLDEALNRLPDLKTRKTFRFELCRAKVEKEKNARFALCEAKGEKDSKNCTDARPFNQFQSAFWDRSKPKYGARFPADQRIYIGNVGLDVDARALARHVQRQLTRERAPVFLKGMFDRVSETYKAIIARPDDSPEADAVRKVDEDFSAALVVEGLLEQAVPAYQLFRTYYRDEMIAVSVGDGSVDNPGAKHWPKDSRAENVEFVFTLDGNKAPGWLAGANIDFGHLKIRKESLRKAFINQILAYDDTAQIKRQSHDGLMQGRLANPSRLVFRVSCADWAELVRLDRRHLDQPEDAAARVPRSVLPFTLAGLTNFSDFELAVTRRAARIYAPDESGRLDRLSQRTLSVSPGAMLDHLGFESGPFVTSATRLSNIQATLRHPPGPFETAIEIPARLILSPHQDAVVISRSTGRPPDAIFAREEITPPAGQPLWTADFLIEAEDPGLRAVHSPDLRSEALWGRTYGNALQELPNGKVVGLAAAPTRGPVPPWFYGKGADPVGARTVTFLGSGGNPEDLDETGEVSADHAFAYVDQPQVTPTPRDRVAAFCKAFFEASDRADTKNRDARFRTTLDAFDRHELVMLSSGWGLPVLGRRNAADALVSDSSQVEPEPRHRLIDLQDGSALYQPRPLEVTELSLSALGGTLRHDSSFEPPAAALRIGDRQGLFDALSIERWQQWTVLSRDVFSEVTYRGFLFPLGHRASLVKVTQREFLRDPDGGIRAYLRQRKFIRLGKPEKRFPAIFQPFEGRMFPVELLNILTAQTPDIVDPDHAVEVGKVSAQGRIGLTKRNALAFWPRTAPLAEANIRFEMEVDGAKSDLPLIFVDNVTANDHASLAELAAYYNRTPSPDEGAEAAAVDPVRHIRTVRFDGGKRRYAPELKAGSTSLETDHWTLKVSGRFETVGAIGSRTDGYSVLDPQMGNFASNPVMQGADQPPFYPMVDVARIRARQAERLVGTTYGPLRARFDFAFLRDGFPEVEPGAVLPNNASELFLNLVQEDQKKQNMGTKGDNSGGVFRPSGHMVAFSRGLGVLTNDTSLAVPVSDSFAELADWFDHTAASKSDDKQTRNRRLTPSNMGKRGQGQTEKDAADAAVRDIYKKIFDDSAKILGLVSLKDLMEVLEGLQSPNTGMPALDEQIRYGAGQLQEGLVGALDQLPDEARELEQQISNRSADIAGQAAEGAELVRLQVVKPLAQAVEDIRSSWDVLEAKLVEEQQSVAPSDISAITIREIFPELDSGLNALRNALRDSAIQSDAIAFALSLGAVYEAGRRFINALKRSLANPVARIEGAFRERFDALWGIFKTAVNGLPSILESLADAFLKEQRLSLARALPAILVPDERKRMDLVPIRLPSWTPIPAEDLVVSPGVNAAEVNTILARLYADAERLRELVSLPPGEVRGLLGHVIHFALEPDRLKDLFGQSNPARWLLDEFLQTRNYSDIFFDFSSGNFPTERAVSIGQNAETQIRDRLQKLGNDANDVIDGTRTRIEADLVNLKGKLEQEAYDQLEELIIPFVADVLTVAETLLQDVKLLMDQVRRDYAEELAFITQLITTADAFRRSFDEAGQAKTPKPVLEASIDLLEVFIGPVQLGADEICKAANDYLAPLRKIVGYYRPDGLALSDPKRVTTPFEVRPFEWETGPELLYVAYEGGVLPGGKSPATRVYAAQAELKEALEKAYAELPGVKARMQDFVEDVPDEAQERINSFAIMLETDLEEVLPELAKVSSALAVAHGDMVLADRGAVQLRKQLRAIDELDLCSTDLEAFFDTASRLPSDIQSFAARYPKVLGALETSATAVATAVDRLFGGSLPWVALSGLVTKAAVETDYFEGLVADARKTAKDYSVQLSRLEHSTTIHVAGLLKDVVGVLRAQSQSLTDLVKELVEIQNVPWVRQLAVFDGLDANLRELEKVGPYLKDLEQELGTIAGRAGQTDPANFARLQDLRAPLENGPPPLQFVGVKIDTTFDPKQELAEIREITLQAEAEFDKLVAHLRSELRRAETAVLSELDVFVKDYILTPKVSIGDDNYSLAGFYDEAIKLRTTLVGQTPEVLADTLTKEIAVRPAPHHFGLDGFSPAPTNEIPTLANDALAADAAWLKHLIEKKGKPLSDPKQRRFLTSFITQWSNEASAPILIGKQAANVLSEILRGDIMRFVDLAAIRAQIEDYLLDLVPSEIQMRYRYGVPLGDPVTKATGGIFAPAKKTRLDVRTGIVIKLNRFQPSIEFSSKGTIGAFDIKLVGDAFDALTLKFKGATFETSGGSKPRFDITYDDYVIGTELQFLQDLQSILSPSEGSGAFILPRFDLPGVEAGYSMNLGMFSIGAASFFNIALRTSAILPFGPGAARFRAALSSRSNPFTISYLPFGGSGFFAIEANADGIVGFEAQFEFGGAAAFGFGPLTGQGRLMSGIYVRQITLASNQKLTEITGTFYIGGSARIWIFGFGASLSVRLGMVNGNMSGEAVFTYSFSIGFKDFDFSVTVWKQEGEGFSGQAHASLLGPGGTRFAGGDGTGSDAPLVETDALCPDKDFGSYLDKTFDDVPNSRDFF
ncbi:MAG: hypothetical protein GJ676_05695 [Rhodobacteraceae bacterium]|nr:hypothetical protein [Paracoccaceae bacterium]